jgi:Voltage-dependent anion channel
MATGSIWRILGAVPPASGAVVMGTGIVSIALSVDGRETLSRILLVICAAMWVILGVLLGVRLRRDRERVRQEAHSPAALTGVAGTEVLGTGLALLGWNWAANALLVAGLALWLALLLPVLSHWTIPTIGVSLMLTVATEALAVLAATLAVAQSARWLLIAALAPFVLGLAFYGFGIARFDFRQLVVGRGDHWITGGALAISTLTAARIALAGRSLHALAGIEGALKGRLRNDVGSRFRTGPGSDLIRLHRLSAWPRLSTLEVWASGSCIRRPRAPAPRWFRSRGRPSAHPSASRFSSRASPGRASRKLPSQRRPAASGSWM